MKPHPFTQLKVFSQLDCLAHCAFTEVVQFQREQPQKGARYSICRRDSPGRL
jgi:hypothetical protein